MAGRPEGSYRKRTPALAGGIYEQAKKAGKATGLVEQHRENLFHTSVANIPPHSLVAIEIAYQFDVAPEGNNFSLRLPMAVTPRFDDFSPEDFLTQASGEQGRASRALVERLALFDFENGNNPYTLNITMDPGFALALLQSPSHRIETGADKNGLVKITTADKFLKGEQDFVLEWAPKESGKPLTFLHSEQLDGNVYSHLVILPPQDTEKFARYKAQPRQVTLIIDISGSMAGPSIRQAKAALIEAIEDLSPEDYFNIISFESRTGWLFGRPRIADAKNRKKAVKWVAGLDANGGTNMQPAITRALAEETIENHLRQIVFITDGAISYEGQLGAYIRDHVGDARFYAVGIGAAPNAHLMRLIAMTGRGTFTFISDIEETGKKMGALFKKMKTPVLYDLALHLPDDINAEIIPSKIPDLMAGEPVMLAVKSDRPLRDIGLSGWRGGESWTHDVVVKKRRQAEGIGRIYARHKIQELRFNDPAGTNPESEERITDLGLEHQIVSAYTSFVAVDEKIIRPQGAELSFRRYDPNLPKGWKLAEFDPREAAEAYDRHLRKLRESDNSQNELKHDINLPQTASNWMIQVFLGLLLLIAGGILWQRKKGYVS